MVSSARAGSGHVSRRFVWAASKQTWIEILATAVLAGAALAALALRDQLGIIAGLLIWSVLLLCLAVVSRRAWQGLFGPVLFYDLVRVSRRSRNILLRCLYAILLLVVLCWQYYEVFAIQAAMRPAVRITPTGQIVPPTTRFTNLKLMADFAEHFFNTFMTVQFFVVLMLTPIYAAGNIAEEKDRKTLEFLLATDLSNREIVLSKLTSRLVTLGLTIMTGLPILGVVQFMGGVDPDLLLAGFAATGITMVSLTALSTLMSVYARKPRDAILFTYLAVAAYVGLGVLAEQFRTVAPTVALATGRGGPIDELVNLFNAGNIPILLYNLRNAYAGGTSLTGLIAGMAKGYLLFHAAVAVICVSVAVARIRSVALRQQANTRKSSSLPRRPPIRPRLAIQPMVWKEVFVEPGFRLNWLGWIVVGLFVLISLLPAISIGIHYYESEHPTSNWQMPQGQRVPVAWPPQRGWLPFHGYVQELNSWVRITTTLLGCLLLLAVAARASTSISGERDRETLDGLLTSPLRSHDILFGKWLGSLLTARWVWIWLWLIWIIAIITQSLHPLAAPLFIICWLVYASCFVAIGLWFSTICRTSLRAMLWTLATSIFVGGGHLLCWMCCLAAVPLRLEFSALEAAFTPPWGLYTVLTKVEELKGYGTNTDELKIIGVFFTLFFWVLGSLFLWTITRSRFRRITARMPYRRRRSAVNESWQRSPRAEFDSRSDDA